MAPALICCTRRACWAHRKGCVRPDTSASCREGWRKAAQIRTIAQMTKGQRHWQGRQYRTLPCMRATRDLTAPPPLVGNGHIYAELHHAYRISVMGCNLPEPTSADKLTRDGRWGELSGGNPTGEPGLTRGTWLLVGGGWGDLPSRARSLGRPACRLNRTNVSKQGVLTRYVRVEGGGSGALGHHQHQGRSDLISMNCDRRYCPER